MHEERVDIGPNLRSVFDAEKRLRWAWWLLAIACLAVLVTRADGAWPIGALALACAAAGGRPSRSDMRDLVGKLRPK
jgi:hypothetical protein